ncbi:hypothetical protein AB0D08_11925 [Kitasatospora sp. NPDC048540]|uniref:hypothetical protein n=1 Tax=Kitasatospora sp. NPDC048540 TaxID=3155634 RepID=UPI0033CF2B1E
MTRGWEADESATFVRRAGKSAAELGSTGGGNGCPDIWELSNGDFAIIGRDLTDAYAAGLPDDVSIGPDERLVVIPRIMVAHAKLDFPDA